MTQGSAGNVLCEDWQLRIERSKMKEIQQVWRKSYKGLKLFRNDLETIINIAKEYEQSDKSDLYRKIHIVVGDFLLDDVSELKEIKEKVVSSFSLNTQGSSLLLNIDKHLSYLRVDDNKNNLLIGIAQRIDDVLQTRQRGHKNFLFGIKSPTIIMSHSNESSSFFKRNKDKLLLSIIVAAITTFISVSGTLLIQWLAKKP